MLRHWAAGFHGTVILPGDTAYESGRRVWNLAVDRRPAAIVRCADTDDIRRAIDLARTRDLPLAVRSGGHSQAGHGTCEDGIVLDLGALTAIEVDAAARVARVGSGARVADVQKATQAHGLLTPMGGCPEVGIGGLTLGGGENFLMATYGIVCDNVAGAEVVTADARVLRASASEHADLFWAIRGGGGNFGVVTAFEYRLHPAFEVLFGQMSFPVARTRETLLRYRELVEQAPDALDTACGLAAGDDGPQFTVTMCFCGGRAEGERILAAFRSALRPDTDTVQWSAYSADLVVPAAPSSGTGLFLSGLHDAVIEAFADAVLGAPRSATASLAHFHGAVTRVPREAMAFPLREPGFDMFITVPWETGPGCRDAEAWMYALAQSLRPFGRGVYVNNLNQHETARVPEAYGPNYTRLTRTKAAYDPSNVWRVNHNIPPAPAPTNGPSD